ncbi:uncharacterized protein BXZ73DRAFT_89414 [Epithele typhae]|uniref:uncharacterized protein n=1 Tax=Epithele typhae TaxID=378194 RepID=UPI0020077C22|nr:uncharacterized protein BXZ73DRAFT_89414 [Epithele typhae]KAH9935921.1 hypothetical protein BXZ73DRAFT_89414 [Epithele typhae]
MADRLESELRRTLLSIHDYFCAEDAALGLPELIRGRREANSRHEASLADARARVLELVERVNEAHHALEARLLDALGSVPPRLRAQRAAEADVTAATIEIALLKLSVVRLRAHRALYGHAAAKDRPDATVARAVGGMYEKLREKRRAQETEARALDGHIEKYEAALSLVDGPDGGFRQIVRDMARVKRDTEECKKDLRRLGWTED